MSEVEVMINNEKRIMKSDSSTEYLNILRWMATIAVVLIHVITAESDIYESYRLLYVIRNLLNWCVPIFVMISGVLFLNPEKKFQYIH